MYAVILRLFFLDDVDTGFLQLAWMLALGAINAIAGIWIV
jgi:hypothetical protein